MVQEVFGYTSSGAGTGDYSFPWYFNSPLTPWNTGLLSGITFNNFTVATFSATGFPQLCNLNTYQSFRVLGSSAQVDIMPQSVTDSVVAVLCPGTNAGVNVAGLLGQRFAKRQVFGSNRSAPSRGRGLTSSFSTAAVLGVPGNAIHYDLSGAYDGVYNTQPLNLIYWTVAIETGDNAILGNPLEITIRTVYDVELFNLNHQTAPVHP